MALSKVTEIIEQFFETSKDIQLTQQIHDPKKATTSIHASELKELANNGNYAYDLKKSHDIHANNTNKLSSIITPYDEALKRGKEWRFMKPIRSLERSIGFVTPIIWSNVIFMITLHVVSTLWFLGVLTSLPKWQTVVFVMLMSSFVGFGVTAGVHRYWSHRSYKAKLPLQLILLACYSIAGQNTIYEWVRNHRVHHKFSESTADPHDANRGFFFAHTGWLMMKKHPDVIKEGRKIDLRDIENDPLIKFHTRYFNVFNILFCFALPSLVPCLAWNESLMTSLLSQAFMRYTLTLNFTWSVNSFAHLWGNKPYDKHIMPAENLMVSIVAMGEGWHNYHHTFPWDYKAAELGIPCNLTTYILDLFAKIGWAYDLKSASPALVKAVAKNRGDNCKKLA